MKKLLIFILVLISFESFGQNPGNYTHINGFYRWRGGMFDSSLHIPRYSTTPSGLRVGSSPNSGLIAIDTNNIRPYYYSGGSWRFFFTDTSTARLYSVTTNDRLLKVADSIRSLGGVDTHMGANNLTQTANRTYAGGGFNYTWNNLGTWTHNFGAGSTNSSWSDGLVILSGRNSAGTGSPSIILQGDNTDFSEVATIANAGAYRSEIEVGDATTGINMTATHKSVGNGVVSRIKTVGDSILFEPFRGIMNIDSLATAYGDSTGNKPMVWNKFSKEWRALNSWGEIGLGGTSGLTVGVTTIASGTNKRFLFDNSAVLGESSNLTQETDQIKITGTSTSVIPLLVQGTPSIATSIFTVENSAGSDYVRVDQTGGTQFFGTLTAPTGSGGVEIEFNTGTGVINSYNRGGSAYTPLTINGNPIHLRHNGVTKVHVSGNGAFFGGTTSATALAHLGAGTASANTAPLKFTSGTNLSTTEAGAIEYDGTHLYFTAANSGPRYQLDQQHSLTKSKGVFIQNPTSADIVDVWQTPVAITITSLKAILRGTTPSVTYNIRFGTDITSATTVFTSDITCTSVTTGCSNSSGFNDATIPAGSFIWVYTTAASGTINSIGLTINYTED